MTDRETSLGGSRGEFPSTPWTALGRLNQADAARSREILGHLLGTYWRPIYLTVRNSWNKSVEDAKDLTQEFLSRLLDGEFADQVEPAAGRFRDWLKASLKHFMLNARREQSALKRGGHLRLFPLGEFDEARLATDGSDDPASVFDRTWAREVLSRAVDDLRAALVARGKAVYFEVFRLQYLEGNSSYREIGDRLGISTFDVGNYLKEARAVLREMVARQVGAYARDPDEARRELTELLGDAG